MTTTEAKFIKCLLRCQVLLNSPGNICVIYVYDICRVIRISKLVRYLLVLSVGEEEMVNIMGLETSLGTSSVYRLRNFL